MITYVRLQYFRSYTDGSFEFDPGVNIIVGPNASGKTTIIEAILLALQGNSFKSSDTELRKSESEWTRVDVGTQADSRVVKISDDTKKDATLKIFEIEGNTYKRLSRERSIPVVLFEPNHLLLFNGSPELRRSFLDNLIAQTVPGYTTVLRHYKRVLAQRNALLKQPTKPSSEQLFVWNLRLSELAGKIVFERQSAIAKFNQAMSKIYSEISGTPTTITFIYNSRIPTETYETSFLQVLERTLDRDTILGFTSHGPHREDVTMHINGKPAGDVASRGEIRSLVLVLKMLEAQFIEEARGKRPILLFDDVFSELDGKRRQALVAFLKPYQSLITTTDADVVIDHFTDQARIIALQ